MKYYLIAGEASGDLHAAHLMEALQQQDAQASFRFFGGDEMAKVGGTLVRHYRTLAYMGFLQVALHLREILDGMRLCKQDIAAYVPNVVILVDYPGFNLDIARYVKQSMPTTKVVYYISPKIWAWKSYRLRNIKRDVDLLLSILPFEKEWFRLRGYDVQYVGNPTVDELAPIGSQPFDRDAFCQRIHINANQSIIALLPGSRKAEIQSNLSLMLQAATTISCHQILVAGAPGIAESFYEETIRLHNMVPPVKVLFGETYNILRAAEVAAVTSGTATLETAYLRCPQVVCYYFGGGKWVYKIMKRVLRHIRFVSLVNLILDGFSASHPLTQPAVPELLGYLCTPDTLHQSLVSLCDGSALRQRMLSEYDRMISRLGKPGAPQRAAALIIKLCTHTHFTA